MRQKKSALSVFVLVQTVENAEKCDNMCTLNDEEGSGSSENIRIDLVCFAGQDVPYSENNFPVIFAGRNHLVN